eukprot:9965462-Alexandrium_andersonii.AAC.1
MSASLVGSEMCIRDSTSLISSGAMFRTLALRGVAAPIHPATPYFSCLLYTSDAADDMQV